MEKSTSDPVGPYAEDLAVERLTALAHREHDDTSLPWWLAISALTYALLAIAYEIREHAKHNDISKTMEDLASRGFFHK